MTSTEVKKQPPSLIVGYGELTVFEKLVAHINNEFKTNPRYQRSVNSIDIRMRTDTVDTVFDIVIDTKYYTFESELHVASNEKDLRTKLLEKRASTTIEGLIVALDHASTSAVLPPPCFIKSAINIAEFRETFVDSKNGGLNLLVHVGTTDPNIKKTAKQEMEKISEEVLEFELYLDNTAKTNTLIDKEKENLDEDEEEEEEEEDFSALDELINCLFVHNWVNMDRKNEKDLHKHRKELNRNLRFFIFF